MHIHVHTSKMLLQDNKYITSVTLKLAGGCVVYTTFLHLIWGGDWKMWLWTYSHGEWLLLAPISYCIVLTPRGSLSIHDIIVLSYHSYHVVSFINCDHIHSGCWLGQLVAVIGHKLYAVIACLHSKEWKLQTAQFREIKIAFTSMHLASSPGSLLFSCVHWKDRRAWGRG